MELGKTLDDTFEFGHLAKLEHPPAPYTSQAMDNITTLEHRPVPQEHAVEYNPREGTLAIISEVERESLVGRPIEDDLRNENGQIVVSSRMVAERFGKQHKHVLESIENITAENSALINKYDGGQKSSAREEIAVSMEQVKTRKKKNTLVQSDAVIDLKNDMLKGNILGLAKHYDEIMKLLTWHKAFGGQVSSNEPQVIEVIQHGIKIELPKSESTKTSIRVNKEVWEQFGQFAELHSNISLINCTN